MFGYVLPKSETLEVRDFMMFQSAYCGICMSTKRQYGNLARLTTNYDMTFLALLVIEAVRPAVEFKTCRCIGDPRKKPYASGGFMTRIVDANILLCRYKIADDAVDGGSKHKAMRAVLKKPYAAAKARNPEADRIIREGYERLREMEMANVASVDRTADCFAKLMEELAVCIVKDIAQDKSVYYNTAETEDERSERLKNGSQYMTDFRALCYNIGKFVYLADGLDDIDEDHKKKNYNPFLAVYPDYGEDGRAGYIGRHERELGFAFNTTVNRAIESLNRLPLTQVSDLLKNVIYEGLRAKTEELFSSKKKLRPPTLRLPRETVKKFKIERKANRQARDKEI